MTRLLTLITALMMMAATGIVHAKELPNEQLEEQGSQKLASDPEGRNAIEMRRRYDKMEEATRK